MEQQIYCDGIGRISIIEGMVRLDLYSFSPNETDATGNPRPVLSHRVVMGMDAFLRSSEKVVEAVKLIGQARQQQQQARQPQQPQPPQPQAQSPAPSPQPVPVQPARPAPTKPPFP